VKEGRRACSNQDKYEGKRLATSNDIGDRVGGWEGNGYSMQLFDRIVKRRIGGWFKRKEPDCFCSAQMIKRARGSEKADDVAEWEMKFNRRVQAKRK